MHPPLRAALPNFCSPHDELSKSLTKGGFGFPCTPAMASGLTDHVWSVRELLTYKVAPPPLPIPKKKDVLARNTLKLHLLLRSLLCECERGFSVHPPLRAALPIRSSIHRNVWKMLKCGTEEMGFHLAGY